jgi:integrase
MKQQGLLFRPHPRGTQRDAQGQRGDWWISFVCTEGHRHRSKIGAKAAARAEHGRIRALIRREGYCPIQAQQTRPLALAEVLALVVTDYENNGRRTTRRIHQLGAHLQHGLGAQTPARLITTIDIAHYTRRRLEDGATPASVNRELACLKRGLRLAARAGRLPAVPPIAMLQERNVRTGFFEDDEYRAVLTALPERLRPVITCLYLTGWRLNEVLSLTWAQVDFRAHTIRLEPGTTKNQDGRVFPFALLPDLELLLRRQRIYTTTIERATDRLISRVFHREGQPIRDLRGAWESACAAAGFSRIVLPRRRKATKLIHDFRRTAVRNLERAGVSRSVAMKLTGHKTESVYRRYAIVSEGDLAEGVGKLARLITPHRHTEAKGTE